MTFAAAQARQLDAIYRTMGVAATWTPAGGSAQAVTLVPFTPEDPGMMPGALRKPLIARRYRLRVAEAAAVSPGVNPKQNDAVVLTDGPEALKITAQPMREDTRRLEWFLTLGGLV